MAKLVMTVDDSKTVRQVLNTALEGAGYEVIEASDGVEAVKLLAHSKIDVLVTDLNMPNMDGLSLVKQVRRSPGNRFLPIIMLSSESQAEKKQEGKAAGVSGWIVKPFKPEQVLSIVQMVCPL